MRCNGGTGLRELRGLRVRCKEPPRIAGEDRLRVGREFGIGGELGAQLRQAGGERRGRCVGEVGAVEDAVGRGEGEQAPDALRRGRTREVEPEGAQVGVPVDLAGVVR